MASGFPDWLRAFSMLGKYGTEYKVVAVTEEGNLYVLLQGEDADEVLRTVRLDDQGRLSAFIIDSVDAWNQMLTVGNAELAARLGSPLKYDRRGSIVVATDFSLGYGVWVKKYSGSDSAVTLTPDRFATGGYSVECLASAAGAADSGLCAVIPTLPSAGRGVSCLFSMFATMSYLEIDVYCYDGDDYFRAYAKYDHAAGELEIRDEDLGAKVVVEDVTIVPSPDVFNFFKVTFDTTTGMYKELLFNDVIKDLSAYKLETDESGTTPRLDITIKMHNRYGEADKVYIDSAIVTINEP